MLFTLLQEAVNKPIPKLKEEIKELSGIDIGMRKGGIFQFVYSEAEKKGLRLHLISADCQMVIRRMVRKVEPHVTPNIIGAAYIEDDVNCYQFLYVRIW